MSPRVSSRYARGGETNKGQIPTYLGGKTDLVVYPVQEVKGGEHGACCPPELPGGWEGGAWPLQGLLRRGGVVLVGRVRRGWVGSTLLITTFPALAACDHQTGSLSKIHRSVLISFFLEQTPHVNNLEVTLLAVNFETQSRRWLGVVSV